MRFSAFSCFIFTFLCISCPLYFHVLNAQACLVRVQDDSNKSLINKQTTYNKGKNLCTSLIEDYIKRGYVTAFYDTLTFNENEISLKLYKNEAYQWKSLTIENLDPNAKENLKYREKLINNLPLTAKETGKIFDELLTYYENNGYPFVKIKVDSISFDKENVYGKAKIYQGPEIIVDSIYIKGIDDINDKWIRTYLEIKEGNLYSEKKLRDISKKIEFLNYIKEIRPAEVVFTPRGADVYIFLEKVKASSINGIIGFLPNDNGSILVTGDVKLKLENAFNIGERFDLNWRKLQPETQDLRILSSFPLLFGTPFGLQGNFSLYKRDSTFIEIRSRSGLQYRINSLLQLNLLYEFENNSLLGESSTISDPSLGNVRKNAYILGIQSQKLDRFINPSKGYEIKVDFGFVRRNTENNNSTNQTENNPVSTNYNINLNGNMYLPFFKRNVFKIGLNGTHIIAPELFRNELIRFGGLTSFRGFDEESLTASTVGILSAEYRFLLDKYSNIFLFFDGAFYEAKTIDSYIRDLPFGFGGGIQFTTNAGTFVLVYALGKQFDNPILLKTGKIHFGYINFF